MKRFLFHSFLLLLTAWSAGAQTISQSLCANDPRVKRYFVQNPIPGMAYTWNVSGGGAVLPSGSDTLYVNWGQTPGIYKVSLSGVLNASCETDTASYWIEILPIPILQIQGNTNICAGQKITLNAAGANQIDWSNGTSGNTGEFFPLSPTTIWAKGFDGVCYSDTTYFNIVPVPLPSTLFMANPTQGEVPLTVSFFDQSSNAASYYWDFGNGVTSTQANPSNVYEHPGSYAVSLVTENAAGCKDSITYEFIVVSEVFTWFVPNSFTPNGDNSNEIFRPYFPNFVEYTFRIFDRWGGLVFKSTSMADFWDGTKEKKQVPPGIYVYELEFKSPTTGKQMGKTGSVALIR